MPKMSRRHSINYHEPSSRRHSASEGDLEKSNAQQIETPLFLNEEDIYGNVDVAVDLLKGQELAYTEEGGSYIDGD